MDGFQRLLVLSLENPPAADVIGATLLVWSDVISRGRTFDQSRDAPRFREAFAVLARSCRRWPAPVEFIAALPPLPPEHMPAQIDSDTRHERNLRGLKGVLEQLGFHAPGGEKP